MKNATFRFDLPTSLKMSGRARRLKKRALRAASDFTPVSADSNFITISGGRFPIDAYPEFAEAGSITLTRREADLIALSNPGTRPPEALENLFPWLPRHVYVNDSDKNFQRLRSVLQKFGDHLLAPDIYCDKKWNKVCNSVRMTTDLDARFYTAWHLPVQGAYVLEERRPNRWIIALDFNAMYPSCMQQRFPNPSKMRLANYHRDILPEEVLPTGLFRCTLRNPTTEFIIRHNPFTAFFSGRYLQRSIAHGITVDLNEFELRFYQRHFDRVYVADAIISDECISHPLARDARRSFSRRLHYRANANKALADREKFLSTLLASCTHRPRKVRKRFASYEAAEGYLKKSLGVRADLWDLGGASERWLQCRKGITISDSTEGLYCRVPDIQDQRACFVFNQRIVARSRVVLLELMEKILAMAPEVEICYANIDSVHFSLPSDYLDAVLTELRRGSSECMGSYKIESVSSGGLWLEPGRYWLYSDKILKYRNKFDSDRGNPFADHAFHVAIRNIGDLHVPIRMNLGMDRSMSDTRSIADDPVTGLSRQQLVTIDEASSPESTLSALERNRARDIPRRLHAFKHLAALHERRWDLLPQDPTA